jgi:hypothetical protein
VTLTRHFSGRRRGRSPGPHHRALGPPRGGDRRAAALAGDRRGPVSRTGPQTASAYLPRRRAGSDASIGVCGPRRRRMVADTLGPGELPLGGVGRRRSSASACPGAHRGGRAAGGRDLPQREAGVADPFRRSSMALIRHSPKADGLPPTADRKTGQTATARGASRPASQHPPLLRVAVLSSRK